VTTILILQAVVFALWAVTAFRILFHLRRKGEERTGRVWNGPIVFLTVARAWLSDPTQAKWRRDFLVLTLVLIGLTIAFATRAA
jgi:hypothetical protein